MATREIPAESWISFFDDFSRRHHGWLVEIEVLGALGAQLEAEQVPLEGISGDHANKDISIALRLPDKIVEHFIMKPERVRVEENGEETAIQIESAEGESTILRLRAAVPSETAGQGRN